MGLLLGASAAMQGLEGADKGVSGQNTNVEAKGVVTDQDRAELLENWVGSNAGELASLLKAGDSAGFDRALLQYMRARKTPRFYFTPAEIPERIAWITAQMPKERQGVLDQADAIMSGKFPRSTNPTSPYDLQMPEGFNWHDCITDDPETLFALNRHKWWIDLGMAYRYTGDSRYIDELKKQVSSWSKEKGRPSAQSWGRWLEAGIRGTTWVWAYFLVYDTEAWTPEINTLFLHRLLLHNIYLADPNANKIGNNWVIMQSQGMLNIAILFPEFKQSPAWEKQAIQTLGAYLNNQFRADGMHQEMSVGYHVGGISWFLEPLWLAKVNGRELPPQIPKLGQAAETLYQLLHPDGTQPLLGDTDLLPCRGELVACSIVMGEPKWANLDEASRATIWLFGPAAIPRKTGDIRPRAVEFKDSGHYVMRTGDQAGDCQLTFDCGPWGGFHGHLDLLSFELYGFNRALLCDLGRGPYNESADRAWTVSTPAHNTISVDGLNEETDGSLKAKCDALDTWEVADDHILVQAHHRGYAKLPGAPVVGRSIWYDRKNTFVILDWGNGAADHDYTVSFTFPGNDASPLADGRIRSQRAQGNVLVQNISMPGQVLAKAERFWVPRYGTKEPAVRYTASQTGKQAVFGHIVSVFDGKEPPSITASWEAVPALGKPAKIKLSVDGVQRVVEFQPVWESADLTMK